jgi:hypothetical protein
VKKINNNFRNLIEGTQSYKTPGTANFGVVRPSDSDSKIKDSDQVIYGSAVRSLIQLVKHSRPVISNAVGELSKCMDGATPAAMKELKRLLRFLADAKDYGLKIEPL